MVGIIPLSVELLKPIAEVVSEKRIFIYDDFERGMAPQLWEVRKPAHTPEDKVEYKPQWERSQLVMITKKRGPKIEYPRSWEGYEIVAKKPTNRVQARMTLDFDGSTADNGNIHVKAKGATGRFLYLIGIDKRSKDIFFHCIDEETGYYIKSGGRIHFKDYFLDAKKWVVLGIEWGYDGVGFIISGERGERFDKYLFRASPDQRDLQDKIRRDARETWKYGTMEFSIRTDLEVEGSEVKSIIGHIDYVKVRYPLIRHFALSRKKGGTVDSFMTQVDAPGRAWGLSSPIPESKGWQSLLGQQGREVYHIVDQS